MAKTQMVKQISDLSGISDHIALFGATKQHATGPEHDKERHGINNITKQCSEQVINMLQELIIAKQGMA